MVFLIFGAFIHGIFGVVSIKMGKVFPGSRKSDTSEPKIMQNIGKFLNNTIGKFYRDIMSKVSSFKKDVKQVNDGMPLEPKSIKQKKVTPISSRLEVIDIEGQPKKKSWIRRCINL
ncbi:hypothetical protein LCGC14_1518900 [marine sediment metagenome]|uniref:Uncharacterized protein n=1 Tax=marine sediment metagenome TaxID=412755 RepID=A0A0F9M0B0_9ZZZZ